MPQSSVRWALTVYGLASSLAACASAPTAHGQPEPRLSPGDQVIADLALVELDPKGFEAALPRLVTACEAGDQDLCRRLLMRREPFAGSDRVRQTLMAKRAELSPSAWLTLVSKSPKAERKDLAAEALARFPERSYFRGVAGETIAPEEAIKAFATDPSFETMYAMVAVLAGVKAWSVLDEGLTAAAYAQLGDVVATPEFWLARRGVAEKLGAERRASAFGLMAHMVRKRGQNKPEEVHQFARACAISPQTAELVEVLLTLPGAKGLNPEDKALSTALRLHRAQMMRLGLRMAPMREGKDRSPFGGGILGALLLNRFSPDQDRALEMVRAAATEHPNVVQGWQRLAQQLSEAGDNEGAIRALRTALRGDGGDPDTLNNLAYMMTIHRPDELPAAEALVRRSLRLHTKVEALDTLAELRFRQGDRVGALYWIRLALKLRPNRPFLKAQEARIIAGDPKAPVPDDEP